MYSQLTKNRNDANAILAGAERYIRSERSDPFTRNRVMSHIHAGLCNPTVDKGGNKVLNHYDASEGRETRVDPAGNEFEVPVFSNIKRL